MSTRTIALTLAPTDAQTAAFMRLRRAFVDACNDVSGVAFETQIFNGVRLHHLVYHEIRARYGLMAQHAVRVIGVVAASYKADAVVQRTFRHEGAVVLDTPRLYRLEGNHIDVTTLDGRLSVKLNIGGIQRDALKRALRLGEADLICDRKGRWRLMVSAHYPDAPVSATDGVIGIDLGKGPTGSFREPRWGYRRAIAVTSDGESFSGGQVRAVRDRYMRTRTMIQANVSKGTRSSRRRGRAVLARLSGRERRFQAQVNHTISRRIVNDAVHTERALALEDLTGIRERTNGQPRSTTERRRSNAWAFFQLRLFLTYKCEDAGIPFVTVDPRYTSQTCHCCLWIGERAGKAFHCVNPSCLWSGDADWNGALNIALLGAIVLSPRGPYPSCSLEQKRWRASESCLL